MKPDGRNCLVFVCILSLVACSPPEPPAKEDQAIRPARVIQVQSNGAAQRVHEFVGRIEAAQVVDLKFEVAGTIIRLNAREGETIKAGTLVASLDRREFELAVREAEVQRQLALQDLERKSALLRKRVISQSIVDDAQALRDLRQVHLEQARKRLTESQILAPFDAYVVHRFVDNHVVVQPGDAVARLSDLNELVVSVSIPERLLATVGTSEVEGIFARFPFLPDEQFALAYRENKGEADPVAQTYDVTFTMPPPERWNILPGMTATVALTLKAAPGEQTLLVPGGALAANADGGLLVWLVDRQSGEVRSQEITVAPNPDGRFRVLTGLSGGEWIVAAGANQLQPGMRVRPLDDA